MQSLSLSPCIPHLQQTYPKRNKRRWCSLNQFFISYTVSQRAWRGAFTPEECRGVLNYQDGSFRSSYLPIGAIPTKRGEDWQEIENPDKLAVSLPGLLLTTERVLLIDETNMKWAGTEIWRVSEGSGKRDTKQGKSAQGCTCEEREGAD